MPPRIRTSRRKRPSWRKLKHPLSASKFLALLNCSTSLLRQPTAQHPPYKLETERPLMFDLDRYLKMALGLGCTEDQVKNNLDHYRLDADYKHGMHYTALPTAWVSGFDKTTELRIGSRTAWVSDTPGATAGFLEFKGEGLSTFERAMDRDEKLMAVLGSRLLEGQKKVGEAAQAIELRQAGENSILSSRATSVSQSLTQVLRWIYWWNSIADSPDDVGPDKVLVELNTDFSTKGMDPQELSAIVAAWQAGAISRDTMTDLFRRGEVLPEGRTDEEEIRAIQSTHSGGRAASPAPSVDERGSSQDADQNQIPKS